MKIDQNYLVTTLKELLAIPSPVGYTEEISTYITKHLGVRNIAYKTKRRGTIVATLSGERTESDRALSTHLDTLGAMVKRIKPDGRIEIAPLGSWSARFAEGGRVTIITGKESLRGTVLPIRSSGHVYGDGVDTLPVGWEYVELRLDSQCTTAEQVHDLGIIVGSFVAFDPNPEFLSNGYIVSRYLDDKAGVACLLTAIKAVQETTNTLPVECHPIFSLSEETGCGCGHAPDADVGELVSIDIGPVAPGQNSSEHTANICVKDMSGVYHSHLTKKLMVLCKKNNIPYKSDIYQYYRSDTNSAIVAGNDLLHGLITFGTESTHGYERTHIDSLIAVTQLIIHYMLSE